MLTDLAWWLSAPLIDVAGWMWLSGHALPVLALAAFLLLAAVFAARRLPRCQVAPATPGSTFLVATAGLTVGAPPGAAPPLTGATSARAPGRTLRALPTPH